MSEHYGVIYLLTKLCFFKASHNVAEF